MKGRFEWHITCEVTDRSIVKDVAEKFGHTFSQISGCPILGQGDYCYVTGYDTDAQVAKAEMDNAALSLVQRSVRVLRAKIEDIVYDTRTGVDRLKEDAHDESRT
jgi:hypothetical protein